MLAITLDCTKGSMNPKRQSNESCLKDFMSIYHTLYPIPCNQLYKIWNPYLHHQPRRINESSLPTHIKSEGILTRSNRFMDLKSYQSASRIGPLSISFSSHVKKNFNRPEETKSDSCFVRAQGSFQNFVSPQLS